MLQTLLSLVGSEMQSWPASSSPSSTLRACYSDGLQLCRSVLGIPEGQPGLAGYVECVATRSKTSFNVERKTMLLPMVKPRHGLAGRDWFGAWMKCRERARVPEGEGAPLPPAPSDLGWHRTPLRPAAPAEWLRDVLV